MSKSKKQIISELSKEPPRRPDMPLLSEIKSERILIEPEHPIKTTLLGKKMYVGFDNKQRWKDVLILILLGGLLYAIFFKGRYGKDKSIT